MPTLYCPECDYNLTGLPENRCPECGKAFDPAELFEIQSRCITNQSLVLQLIFVPMGIAALEVVILLSGASQGGVFGLLFALFVLAAITVVAHGITLAQRVVQAKQALVGRSNACWVFRNMGPCFCLFAAIESVLVVTYTIGGIVTVVILWGLI